jgi:hypothetical protein
VFYICPQSCSVSEVQQSVLCIVQWCSPLGSPHLQLVASVYTIGLSLLLLYAAAAVM